MRQKEVRAIVDGLARTFIAQGGTITRWAPRGFQRFAEYVEATRPDVHAHMVRHYQTSGSRMHPYQVYEAWLYWVD